MLFELLIMYVWGVVNTRLAQLFLSEACVYDACLLCMNATSWHCCAVTASQATNPYRQAD